MVAQSLLKRFKGLLGCKSLEKDTGLWIPKCNSIHTFFMKFPIDAIFVDSELKVCAIYENLKPWRLTPFIWKASSVFELASGVSREKGVKKGDKLYVDS